MWNCRAKNDSQIISYKTLRRLIGILGIALSFACMLGGWVFTGSAVQESLSYYYYTNMRDLLTGIIVLVSVFLITYRGPEVIDNVVTTIAGSAGLCTAVFPCLLRQDPLTPQGIFHVPPGVSDVIHIACASLFFVLLAVISLFLFTMTGKNQTVTPEKIKRNRVYIACGVAILVFLVGMLVATLCMNMDLVRQYRIYMICEAVMLSGFGVSWLVKGETIFKDKK